jgi:hypothetical protein
VRRALVLAGILALSLSAPAHAGEARLSTDSVFASVSFTDRAGVPDDIRVLSPAQDTITLLGPTVTAGNGCVSVPGGASCTRPADADLWERSSIALGGGDDTLVMEAPQKTDVDGGDGNDRISLAPAASATVDGMAGDDTLTAAGSALLRGGAGSDRLSAGARSALSGGPGTDRLDGSPQNDVLIDAGDGAARDALACNGGADVAQGDETDALEGCASPAIDDIARWKFYWTVLLGPRISVPITLRELHRGSYYGDFAVGFAECAGAACHRARLAARGGKDDWRIVSGGRRVRVKGRWRRGVSPGAIVRVGVEFVFDNVAITKGWEFRTRGHVVPTKRKRCTVAIGELLTAPRREVPCT